jgi:hypothetical protein
MQKIVSSESINVFETPVPTINPKTINYLVKGENDHVKKWIADYIKKYPSGGYGTTFQTTKDQIQMDTHSVSQGYRFASMGFR